MSLGFLCNLTYLWSAALHCPSRSRLINSLSNYDLYEKTSFEVDFRVFGLVSNVCLLFDYDYDARRSLFRKSYVKQCNINVNDSIPYVHGKYH
jgi:hypothetical protein